MGCSESSQHCRFCEPDELVDIRRRVTRSIDINKKQTIPSTTYTWTLSKDSSLRYIDNNYAPQCTGSRDLNCEKLLCLIKAIEQYERMNEEDFASFIEDIYGGIELLNDFNHLILCHGDNLQKIYKRLLPSKCSLKSCECSDRHFGNQSKSFYVSVFDSLHVWLYHCFDAGFRSKKKKKHKKKDEHVLFDEQFSRIHQEIRETDALTEAFKRINNSKFCILTGAVINQGDTTFVDDLFRHITSEFVHIQSIQKLFAYVKVEAYDTDSIKMDMTIDGGNIPCLINNKECHDEIMRFIKINDFNASTFSVGIRYYYWDYYRDIEQLSTKEQTILDLIDNQHDHSGYSVCELYVKPKFTSFKAEVLNYIEANRKTYKSAYRKAKKYLRTEEVKKIRAHCTDGEHNSLFYEIEENEMIKLGHLLALALYCDQSAVSATFSETFRRLTKYEKLKSMKRRNSLFYWMSRYLRELVEIFGQRSKGDTFNEDDFSNIDDGPSDSLNGYFYCGMACTMSIDSFAMRLNGPTSTSQYLEVALKFSGDDGMIFTFDNPSDQLQYCYLRGWNCSWFSNFKQEAEILFFGGYHFIKVFNVRLMKTKSNYQKFIKAIWYFDLMVNGATFCNIKPSKNAYFVVSNLINHVLRRTVNANFDQYIFDTFLCYAHKKKQIILDLCRLNEADTNMVSLIMSRLDKRDLMVHRETKREDTDFRNLFSSDLLCLFPNARKMTIMTTDSFFGTGHSYSFSLTRLLSLISESNLKQITIRAKEYELDNDCSWIQSLWNRDRDKLVDAYFEKNFSILFKDDELRIRKQSACDRTNSLDIPRESTILQKRWTM